MENVRSSSWTRWVTLPALALILALPPGSVFAAADTYPSKPIRLIIPFAPGGVTDIVGRMIASKLSERLGKQVVPENEGGAGGILGLEQASKADPDGYTLCMVTLSYAFKPGTLLEVAVRSGRVHRGREPGERDERPGRAPERPGQDDQGVHCPREAEAGAAHLCGRGRRQRLASHGGVLQGEGDVDFKIVQFKGAGPATVDLLGGHSQFQITSLVSLAPNIKAGKFRALGVCGAKRSPMFPDVPTISEAGAPGYETRDWWGIVAPAGTPAPIVERLGREIKPFSPRRRFKNGS